MLRSEAKWFPYFLRLLKQSKATSDETFRELLQSVSSCKSDREVECLVRDSHPRYRHTIYGLRARAKIHKLILKPNSFKPAFFYWHLHKDGTSSDYLNSKKCLPKMIWQNHN